MSRSTFARHLCAWSLMLLFIGILPAQQITGTLTGLVQDSSGAVLPSAPVSLINEASGSTLRTETNTQGYFSIPAVPSGSYTIRISSPGFTSMERTGIVLRPGDKRHLADLVMQVGSTTETVTVTAAPANITPIDSGEQSSTVTAEQLQNLAVVGRSAAEFIKILPGMAPTGNGLQNSPGYNGENIGINGNGDGGRQSALGYFSANGQRGNAMDIVTDGANTADPGCNCATPVNPNVDMVQEFKVLTGTFSAEHAKGPVVMNAITKSGGRDFHGTGYYYLRDYRLNSNDWALNRAGQKRPENNYQFPGGNIGGPVLIPGTNFNKSRDKLFFFTGFEYYKQRIDTGVLQSIVPNEAMRNGDFSDTAYLSKLGSADFRAVPNLANGSIVGGRIPVSQIESRGRILQSLLPLPNVDPAANSGNNYVQSLLLDQNMTQWVTKVDYNISDYTKMFVRWNRQDELQNFPVQLWGRAGGQVPYPTLTQGDNVSDSISVSLTHVFSPTMTNEFVFGRTFIDFPNSLQDPSKVSRKALGYPVEGIYDNGVDVIPNQRNELNGARLENRGGLIPVYAATKWLTSAGNNLSWFKGQHSMKFGGYWQRITQSQPDSGYSQGLYTFRPNHASTTGNSYADSLMGIYRSYQENNINPNVVQGYDVFEFYAQDSWKVTPRLTLEFGLRMSHLEPWEDRSDNPIGFATFDLNRYSNDPAKLGDLTGLIYNKIDSNVPLGGFGTRALFYQPRFGMAWDLFGTGRTIIRGGIGTFRYNTPTCCAGSYAVAAGLRSTNQTNPGLMKDVDSLSPRISRIGITVVDPNDDNKPASHNWSFEIAQRLRQDTLFTLAYVGNAARNLLNEGGLRDINRIPFGAMLANPDGNVDNFRPFRNYSAINIIRHNFYSNYHSLQSRIQKQMGSLNLQANYTFSKVLGIRSGGDGATANNLSREENYGVLAYDRTHIFNVAYVFDLPRWQGGNAVARQLINGWQISGITTFSTGVELAANSTSNFRLIGFLPDGRTRISNQAITGSPDINAQPFLTCDPRKNLASGQYINGSCFALPRPGVNGNNIFPYLRGPALFSNDVSIFKNFQISESKRFQFRASAYNFINHPLPTFSANDRALNLEFDAAGNMTNSGFGFTNQKTGRRVMQLAVKFYF